MQKGISFLPFHQPPVEGDWTLAHFSFYSKCYQSPVTIYYKTIIDSPRLIQYSRVGILGYPPFNIAGLLYWSLLCWIYCVLQGKRQYSRVTILQYSKVTILEYSRVTILEYSSITILEYSRVTILNISSTQKTHRKTKQTQTIY